MRAIAASVAAVALATLTLGVPHSAHAAADCGSVHLFGDVQGEGRVVRPGGAVTCKVALRVARAAAGNGVDYGETLPAIAGWRCSAALRPEFGSASRYSVGCHRTGQSKITVAVTRPTQQLGCDLHHRGKYGAAAVAVWSIAGRQHITCARAKVVLKAALDGDEPHGWRCSGGSATDPIECDSATSTFTGYAKVENNE